tara:strand:- start:2046 stop:4205 length:2160 start_codon:yes stop_codon:yes gene_type:complete
MVEQRRKHRYLTLWFKIGFSPFIMLFKRSLVLLAVCLSALPLAAAKVDPALIESVILINLDSLRNSDDPLFIDTRNRRDGGGTHTAGDVNASISLNDTNSTGLENAFKALLAEHTDDEIADAVDDAFNYALNTAIPVFGLDFKGTMKALEYFTKAGFEASDQRANVPSPEGLAEKIVPKLLSSAVNWAMQNSEHIPAIARDTAEAIGKGALATTVINSTDAKIAEKLTYQATAQALTIMDQDTSTGPGYFGGIDEVVEGVPNAAMQYFETFDPVKGTGTGQYKFHPDKARFIEYVVNGSTYGIMEAAISKGADVASLAEAIGSQSTSAAVQTLTTLPDGGDHHLFLYETIKAIGAGASYASVHVSGHLGNNPSTTQTVAEKISYAVASSAMEKSIASGLATIEVARLGEASAYGTALGTGLAGSMLDPKNGFDRGELAKSSSKGAANGAMEKAADKTINDATENKKLLELARGTAMGSVLGSTAMSVYNHLNTFEVDVQKIIELSAEGAAFGSMTADLDPDNGTRDRLIDETTGEPKKEEFNVEIARAVANGTSTGALFEITALLATKPDEVAAEINSIKTAKSVSYGTTKGAILGGDAVGVPSDVSVKQATEQGLTEGSMDGVALALGLVPADNPAILSEDAIKNAVGVGNKDGAMDAARSLEIKSINPSVEDMRQLMKLYGIDPRLTNPGFIFPNPKRSGEDNFLFPDEEIKIVSPI